MRYLCFCTVLLAACDVIFGSTNVLKNVMKKRNKVMTGDAYREITGYPDDLIWKPIKSADKFIKKSGPKKNPRVSAVGTLSTRSSLDSGTMITSERNFQTRVTTPIAVLASSECTTITKTTSTTGCTPMSSDVYSLLMRLATMVMAEATGKSTAMSVEQNTLRPPIEWQMCRRMQPTKNYDDMDDGVDSGWYGSTHRPKSSTKYFDPIQIELTQPEYSLGCRPSITMADDEDYEEHEVTTAKDWKAKVAPSVMASGTIRTTVNKGRGLVIDNDY
ncbi:uncharacterized protein LOC126899319 [Daktulosphaira vitifoliae]|uniref:uncharacterized protein LOC126899319 n=1 Tax=Daktulosphaira vitifoliae TaxID=58002 RepID=UPI0021AA77FD|nr:uncharacterized protein LOC126899319 [Daktulosphaira vitifoliae]